jgi:hypothetical protein
MPNITEYPSRDASDFRELGFDPGVWPGYFIYNGLRWHRRLVVRDRENEIQYVIYETLTGAQMHVYND